jgi:hypothetical protein
VRAGVQVVEPGGSFCQVLPHAVRRFTESVGVERGLSAGVP